MLDDRAADVVRRYESAMLGRGNWEQQWEQIARRVLPQYANTFTNRDWTTTPGQPKNEEMVDATAALALPKFAAAMESMLTPRNSTWHRLAATDKTLKANRQVQEYFDDVNEILFKYRYAPYANYASQQHEIYMGLGAFGTGAMYVDALAPRYGGGLRYRTIHLGELYFLENHQGIIDTAIRHFPRTARQAVQQFKDSVPAEVKNASEKPDQEHKVFWFLHEVRPRDEAEGYDPGRKDVKGMAYSSCYVSITGKQVVKEGGAQAQERGHRTFPYCISRYVVAPGEVYGRSPCMLALPAIRVLNEEKRTVLKQGHRAVDPVLLLHDDGVLNMNLTPGAQNYGAVTSDGKPLVHTLPVGDLALAKEMMETERITINDALLVTLFQILVDKPQMTATEVLERAREKGALLSPTMGRQQSEALGPMIDRELDVLSTQGLLPEMPLVLQQARGEYKAEYDSPLSKAQRADGAAGMGNLMSMVQEYIAVTQDPSPADWFDFDEIIPAMADIQAVPGRWIKDPKAVAAVRSERAKQAQMKQMQESAPAMAGVAKALPSLNIRKAFGADGT